jgi:hypothetical protein
MSTPALSEFEEDILGSISNAYEEDPSPESGRTYLEGEVTDDEEFEGEVPYKTAMGLLEKGLLRKVESGTYGRGKNKTKYAHFGLTDAGFEAVG